MNAMNESTATRILYMEDDCAQARIVQKTLRSSGYHVDLASDGEEGLAMYSTGSYDLLVVDQSMPGREGLDVIRTLVSRGSLPPTIMITGTGDEQTAVDAMKLGVSDYVVKSMIGGITNYLPKAIERALEQAQLAQRKQRAEEQLAAQIRELEQANAELQHFNDLAVGRELRMVELKRQVNELACEAGRAPVYDLSFVHEAAEGGSGRGARERAGQRP